MRESARWRPPTAAAARRSSSSRGGRIVAFAGFYREPAAPIARKSRSPCPTRCRAHGIGTRLLEQLARHRARRGIETFDAYVLGDNRRMLDVFRDSGFAVDHESSTASPRPLSLAVTERSPTRRPRARGRRDGVDEGVLRAARGRGRRRQSRARQDRLRDPAQPRRRGIHRARSCRCIRRRRDRGADAPIRASPTFPAPSISRSIVVPPRRCSRPSTTASRRTFGRSASSAPASASAAPEGRAREAALLERIRRAGCRLIGPNCMGLLNTDPAVRLNATFSPVYPPAGNVAMSTQSGALGLAILDYAQAARHRHLELRLGRQQGRRLGQRPDPVLGRRSANVGHPAVSRELRQSEEVQRDRPARRRGRSRSSRSRRDGRRRRLARRGVAHRRARHQRRRRRRAVPAGGRHPDRAARGAVRRRGAAVASAGAARRRVAILTNAGGPASSPPTPARPTASSCPR